MPGVSLDSQQNTTFCQEQVWRNLSGLSVNSLPICQVKAQGEPVSFSVGNES